MQLWRYFTSKLFSLLDLSRSKLVSVQFQLLKVSFLKYIRLLSRACYSFVHTGTVLLSFACIQILLSTYWINWPQRSAMPSASFLMKFALPMPPMSCLAKLRHESVARQKDRQEHWGYKYCSPPKSGGSCEGPKNEDIQHEYIQASFPWWLHGWDSRERNNRFIQYRAFEFTSFIRTSEFWSQSI